MAVFDFRSFTSQVEHFLFGLGERRGAISKEAATVLHPRTQHESKEFRGNLVVLIGWPCPCSPPRGCGRSSRTKLSTRCRCFPTWSERCSRSRRDKSCRIPRANGTVGQPTPFSAIDQIHLAGSRFDAKVTGISSPRSSVDGSSAMTTLSPAETSGDLDGAYRLSWSLSAVMRSRAQEQLSCRCIRRKSSELNQHIGCCGDVAQTHDENEPDHAPPGSMFFVEDPQVNNEKAQIGVAQGRLEPAIRQEFAASSVDAAVQRSDRSDGNHGEQDCGKHENQAISHGGLSGDKGGRPCPFDSILMRRRVWRSPSIRPTPMGLAPFSPAQGC